MENEEGSRRGAEGTEFEEELSRRRGELGGGGNERKYESRINALRQSWTEDSPVSTWA